MAVTVLAALRGRNRAQPPAGRNLRARPRATHRPLSKLVAHSIIISRVPLAPLMAAQALLTPGRAMLSTCRVKSIRWMSILERALVLPVLTRRAQCRSPMLELLNPLLINPSLAARMAARPFKAMLLARLVRVTHRAAMLPLKCSDRAVQKVQEHSMRRELPQLPIQPAPLPEMRAQQLRLPV